MRRVSAASFILEPGDLWRRRIARRFLDQAPRVGAENGAAMFRIPSQDVQIPLAAVPWRGDAIAGLTDPWARAEALEAAGIDAEVLYPTFSWALLAIADVDLRLASLHAYNDWLMDFCGASPWRFGAAAMVSGDEVGREELARWIARGARAAIIGVDGREPIDALLEALVTANIPVLLVRAGGATPASDHALFGQESQELADAHAGSHARFIVLGARGSEAKSGRLHVSAGPADGSAWGLIGGLIDEERDEAFLRENAVAFYGLKTSR